METNMSYIKQIGLVLIPSFFCSFIFVGVLEHYKGEQGFEKSLITEYYRPAMALNSECSKTHNDLFLEYGSLAGEYELMKRELSQLADQDLNRIPHDYALWLKAFYKSHAATKDGIESMQSTVRACRSELYRKMEELALVTGTYEEFIEVTKVRVDSVNNIYQIRKSKTGENIEVLDAEEVYGTMKELLLIDRSDKESLNALLVRIEAIYKPIIESQIIMMETEQDIFFSEQKYTETAFATFAEKISDKFDEGFLSWLI